MLIKRGGKTYHKIVVKEHISLIQEPGSHYVGHVSPCDGKSRSIKDSIMNFLHKNKFSLSQLMAIGCDGTVGNTGIKSGVVRLIEEALGRPLQWCICLLHCNELPLRHLLQNLDGPTAGPSGFSGPIGKKMESCENTALAIFKPITEILTVFPDISKIEDLSCDQKYLYDICQAAATGNCAESLLSRSPGKLSHARWLIAANRIMRLYIGTENPSHNLVTLANFVGRVYGPMWFSIKCHPSSTDGARHLWKMISLSRYLDSDIKKVIDPVIERNSFYAHPENVLLAMMTDSRKSIRELALRRVMKVRSGGTQEAIRKFVVPTLNFEAKDYIDLIDWQGINVTEPPVIKFLSDEVISEVITSGDCSNINFPRFPCHTQSVERCVKLVTEASSEVFGMQRRDGLIRSRIASRKIMPKFNTKKQFRTK